MISGAMIKSEVDFIVQSRTEANILLGSSCSSDVAVNQIALLMDIRGVP